MATTPVSLPGEFHGQRSLTGNSPWGHKEFDTTELLTLSLLLSLGNAFCEFCFRSLIKLMDLLFSSSVSPRRISPSRVSF